MKRAESMEPGEAWLTGTRGSVIDDDARRDVRQYTHAYCMTRDYASADRAHLRVGSDYSTQSSPSPAARSSPCSNDHLSTSD